MPGWGGTPGTTQQASGSTGRLFPTRRLSSLLSGCNNKKNPNHCPHRYDFKSSKELLTDKDIVKHRKWIQSGDINTTCQQRLWPDADLLTELNWVLFPCNIPAAYLLAAPKRLEAVTFPFGFFPLPGLILSWHKTAWLY